MAMENSTIVIAAIRLFDVSFTFIFNSPSAFFMNRPEIGTGAGRGGRLGTYGDPATLATCLEQAVYGPPESSIKSQAPRIDAKTSVDPRVRRHLGPRLEPWQNGPEERLRFLLALT